MSSSDADTDDPSKSYAYMLTFLDMSFVLLTFFIFLNSLAVPDPQRQRNVVKSVSNQFTKPTLLRGRSAQQQADIPIPELRRDFPALSFATQYGGLADAAELANLKVVRKSDRFVIAIPGENLFLSGDASIRAQYLPVLDQIADKAKKYNLAIEIEGHTDNQPIESARFQSNWDLSVARAVSVLRYFLDRGIPSTKLSAAGKGEFQPIAPNDTEQGRAANRRVILVIKEPVPRP